MPLWQLMHRAHDVTLHNTAHCVSLILDIELLAKLFNHSLDSFVPEMCNSVQCAQLQKLLQSHCGHYTKNEVFHERKKS